MKKDLNKGFGQTKWLSHQESTVPLPVEMFNIGTTGFESRAGQMNVS